MTCNDSYGQNNHTEMKISRIEIANFQAHKQAQVDLAPSTTTVKGPTDSGKSAIVRALRWCTLNDIPGSEYVREGAKSAEARITTDAGHKIARRRNANGQGNEYEMNGEVYKSFGLGVPSGIAETLSLSKINFASQHDAPFWFAETAGEVSRQLNAVIDLSVIDESLSFIGGIVRNAQSKKTVREESLAEAEAELEEAAKQKDRIDDFKTIREQNKHLQSVAAESQRLSSLMEKIRSNDAKRLKQMAEEQEQLVASARRVLKLKRSRNELAEIISGIRNYRAKSHGPPPFGEVAAKHKEWMEAADSREELHSLIHAITRAHDRQKNASAELEEAEEEFHQQIKGKVCPLCQNKIQ